MKRLLVLVGIALPLLALARPQPRPPQLQACPPVAPDPWLRWPPMDPVPSAAWESLPKGLARPVIDAKITAASARLEHAAIIPLTLAEVAALAEHAPSPAAALALYVSTVEERVKEADAAVASATDVGAYQRDEQRLAHAQLTAARALKADAFHPYLIRCLDYGGSAEEVWFTHRGSALRTAHGIMTHGCPSPTRQPFVIFLPFAPTELYVTVSAAA